MAKFLSILLVTTLMNVSCYAQQDSTHAQSPTKATLYSTFLPGLGQCYNRKYWKVPIVWTAIGIPAYFYFDSRDWYRKTQRAISLLDKYNALGLPFPADSLKLVDPHLRPFMNIFKENQLRTNRNEYRRDEDYSALFFVLLWALNILDAKVDAELRHYDISNSLSFQVSIPSADMAMPGSASGRMGLNLLFDLHSGNGRKTGYIFVPF